MLIHLDNEISQLVLRYKGSLSPDEFVNAIVKSELRKKRQRYTTINVMHCKEAVLTYLASQNRAVSVRDIKSHFKSLAVEVTDYVLNRALKELVAGEYVGRCIMTRYIGGRGRYLVYHYYILNWSGSKLSGSDASQRKSQLLKHFVHNPQLAYTCGQLLKILEPPIPESTLYRLLKECVDEGLLIAERTGITCGKQYRLNPKGGSSDVHVTDSPRYGSLQADSCGEAPTRLEEVHNSQ